MQFIQYCAPSDGFVGRRQRWRACGLSTRLMPISFFFPLSFFVHRLLHGEHSRSHREPRTGSVVAGSGAAAPWSSNLPPERRSLVCQRLVNARGLVLCADSVSAAGTHSRRRADGRGCLSLPFCSGMHKNSSARSSLRENTPPHAHQWSAFASSPAVDSELNMCVNSVGVSLCVGRRPCTMATILIVV